MSYVGCIGFASAVIFFFSGFNADFAFLPGTHGLDLFTFAISIF